MKQKSGGPKFLMRVHLFALCLSSLLSMCALAFTPQQRHLALDDRRHTSVPMETHSLPETETISNVERRKIVGGMMHALVGITAFPLASFATSTDVSPTAKSPPQATVTNHVFMDVRISRSDGTFYVRDDLPDTPENRVFTGRLEMELFGEAAPAAVQQFLKYVNVTYNPLEDDPLPSYGRSTFQRLDQATGLLTGGNIPSLDVTSFAGSTALQYGGRLLPAPLWVSSSSSSSSSSKEPRLSHNAKGLLTHRILDVTPSFSITTRPAADKLDSSSVVFGRLVLNNVGQQFLRLCEEIPTYSLERPKGDPSAAEDVASAVFNSQREFFRGAAKTFGDTRVSKVYEGKLLRRVEVTQVGLL